MALTILIRPIIQPLLAGFHVTWIRWMTGREAVKEIFERGSQGSDISVIEGVMGMFDGKNPLTDEGSTADIGRILDAPIVLL